MEKARKAAAQLIYHTFLAHQSSGLYLNVNRRSVRLCWSTWTASIASGGRQDSFWQSVVNICANRLLVIPRSLLWNHLFGFHSHIISVSEQWHKRSVLLTAHMLRVRWSRCCSGASAVFPTSWNILIWSYWVSFWMFLQWMLSLLLRQLTKCWGLCPVMKQWKSDKADVRVKYDLFFLSNPYLCFPSGVWGPSGVLRGSLGFSSCKGECNLLYWATFLSLHCFIFLFSLITDSCIGHLFQSFDVFYPYQINQKSIRRIMFPSSFPSLFL